MDMPPTRQVGQHKEHASTEMHERIKTVLRSNWLLQNLFLDLQITQDH